MVFLALAFADPAATSLWRYGVALPLHVNELEAPLQSQQSLHLEPPTHVFPIFFHILSVRQCTTISRH